MGKIDRMIAEKLANDAFNGSGLPFTNGALAGNYDTFKAVGYRDGRVIGQHSAVFTTTAGQDNK